MEDFNKKRSEIVNFIREKGRPANIEEIAKHIGRTEQITEGYCELLSEYGTIKFMPKKSGWGFAVPPA